ncbi:transcriptional regulator [Nocardiopsis sp. TSRI0078]|uniref:LCP family protein n=1 Tax=unclassified Nocardiopsis TaxID=2649073 RepID=UPI00093BE2EA|nr:LCP family protein [Nocardiopsis sp. TSRI0078]OKI23820.1 transcriptional regulator [Nocardiopsis sp. TSRI0078]
MPADENSAAGSGADHTPDEMPENGSEPEGTGSDQAGATDRDDREGPGGTVAGPPEDESGEGKEDADGEGDGAQDAEPSADSGEGSGKGDGDGEAAAAAPPARTRRRRVRRVLVWTAASLALVLAAGVATAYGYYHSLRSGMVQHDIDSALQEGDRPERINDAVNILFMGTDGYEEGSTAYTQEFEGERSDAIMLAHVSPEKRVSVISFPRDSLVNLPQCDPYGDAEGTQAYFGMINAAMYHGGPPCVVRTIESLTDIRIDHFVHLSFMSFRDVVNAIGGVDICIPEPMHDSRSKLDLEAGQQTLDGDEALSFVRARYEIGNGSDIGRIDRQQMFLAALADQVTSSDVLSSPTKLNGILRAVARNSATDREFTLDRMLSLAMTLSGADLTDIEFHTVPWYQAPFDPNRVMWYEEEAAALFTAVREDRPPGVLAADDAAAPQDPPGTSPSPVGIASAHASPPPEVSESARPGQGRDATSDPCSDGLGFGTGEEGE